MKTIHVCYQDGGIETVHIPLDMHILRIAKEYPDANIFWLGAPLDTKPEDYRVIRYVPQV